MEKIGSRLGMRLSVECPELLEVMQKFLHASNSDNIPPPPSLPLPFESQTFKGKIEKFQTDEFSTLTAGNSDERYKFFWMERFPGSEDFEANPQSLVGKEVIITYNDVPYYDAQSGLYRVKKVIRGITVK